MWAQIREESRAKRWENERKSLDLLHSRRFEVKVMNEDIGHYRVGEWDFWPTTGSFYNYRTKKKGRGVFRLMDRIQRENAKQQKKGE